MRHRVGDVAGDRDEGLAGTWCGSLELDEFEDVAV
jgi:hypothetical protein